MANDQENPINPIEIALIERAITNTKGRFTFFKDENFPIIIEKNAKDAYWNANTKEKREKGISNNCENQVTKEGRVFIVIENLRG